MMQEKYKEIAFFDRFAETEGAYDRFTEESNLKIIQACVGASGLLLGERVIDLGCGSGVFTQLMQEQGFRCFGLDISHRMLVLAQRNYPGLSFVAGDVEFLPLRSETLDGVLLSGVLHHLPDQSVCAQEVFRVLKPNGVFVAFDPNRRNPFMWLYRDKNSPVYSSKGVTENERPILAGEIMRVFARAGFHVSSDYLCGLRLRYIASSRIRWALPIYNFLDNIVFRLAPLKRYSAYVVLSGIKGKKGELSGGSGTSLREG